MKKSVHSLKFGMLAVTVFALLLGIGAFFAIDYSADYWIENYYTAQEIKDERYNHYIENLQTYIVKNELSSEDTAEIAEWMKGNRNVYLFLYKDGRLLFDGSLEDALDHDRNPNKNPGASSDEKNDGAPSDGDDELPPADGDSDLPESGDADNIGEDEDAPEDEDSKEDSSGSNTEDSSNGGFRPGGITLDYPSREEIIQGAAEKDMLPLEVSDGLLFVRLVDFTEYVYYDLANIISIASGMCVAIFVLMLYFSRLTSRISRLAKDVSDVYENDMNKSIRTTDGADEFSRLTRNVEQMRSSMLESLKNEQAAIDANTELITSMSHDIRTPLTVLLGYLDIMKSHSDEPVMSEYIKASEVTAMRLKELSDDMFRYFLVFSKKSIDLSISDYEAKTFIEQLVSEHVLLMHEKGYEINIDVDSRLDDKISIRTDAGALMRVIDNLFSNLYKYADREREIRISAFASAKCLTLEITNYLPTSAVRAESNGIGLKTCKKICDVLSADFEYGFTDGERFFVKIKMPIKEAV